MDDWKANLNFTGDCLVFPAEMFVVLIEKKFENMTLDNECMVDIALQYISNSSDNENRQMKLTPAEMWKEKHNFSQIKCCWNAFKNELFNEFGQRCKYNSSQRLHFLQSAKRGRGEPASLFLSRLTLISQIIEFGQICDKPPSSEWIKLLLLLGLRKQEKVFTADEFDRMSLEQICFSLSNQISQEPCVDSNMGYNNSIPDPKENVMPSIIPLDEPPEEDMELYFYHEIDQNKLDTSNLSDISNDTFLPKKSQETKSANNLKRSTPHITLSSPKCNKIQKKSNGTKENDTATSSTTMKMRKADIEANNNEYNSNNPAIKKQSDISQFSNFKFVLQEGGPEVLSCSFCDDIFNTKKEILVHILKYHDDYRYKCDICNFKGKKLRDIARHRLGKHGVETDGYESYSCTHPGCPVKMTCKIKLEQHLRVHDNLRPFVCGVCDKAFQFKGSLKVHTETVHMKLKIHKCVECDKAFSALSGLTYHKAIKHNIGQKEKHACEICGETTYYKASLQKHMEIKHMDRTKIHCPHCNNLFISKLTLNRHIKSQHEKDTKHACPHCTKTFGTSYKQKVHIKTAHQNFRPFRCKLCKALFTEGNNLSVHIASVHDNVPLKLARKSSAAYRKHFAFERLVEGSLSVMDDESILLLPPRNDDEQNS